MDTDGGEKPGASCQSHRVPKAPGWLREPDTGEEKQPKGGNGAAERGPIVSDEWDKPVVDGQKVASTQP